MNTIIDTPITLDSALRELLDVSQDVLRIIDMTNPESESFADSLADANMELTILESRLRYAVCAAQQVLTARTRGRTRPISSNG